MENNTIQTMDDMMNFHHRQVYCKKDCTDKIIGYGEFKAGEFYYLNIRHFENSMYIVDVTYNNPTEKKIVGSVTFKISIKLRNSDGFNFPLVDELIGETEFFDYFELITPLELRKRKIESIINDRAC